MDTFDNIILTGRPASGKSEFIDFLKGVPVEERLGKYHVGEFKELDDFLWVWELGEADDLWEELGRERINTKNAGHGYVTKEPELILTEFMSLKLNRELIRNYVSDPKFYEQYTLIIEFARGGKDAYKKTLNALNEKALNNTAIFS